MGNKKLRPPWWWQFDTSWQANVTRKLLKLYFRELSHDVLTEARELARMWVWFFGPAAGTLKRLGINSPYRDGRLPWETPERFLVELKSKLSKAATELDFEFFEQFTSTLKKAKAWKKEQRCELYRWMLDNAGAIGTLKTFNKIYDFTCKKVPDPDIVPEKENYRALLKQVGLPSK